jgi:hypothetical protein
MRQVGSAFFFRQDRLSNATCRPNAKHASASIDAMRGRFAQLLTLNKTPAGGLHGVSCLYRPATRYAHNEAAQ